MNFKKIKTPTTGNSIVKAIMPPNQGWIEYKLKTQEMDYVWRCIENKKKYVKKNLAGNISASYDLMDRGDWFWLNVIIPLLKRYTESFDTNLGVRVPIASRHPFYMDSWWVNYQKQNEFNPIHDHSGVYSFVIWMKIPYDGRKENQKDIARHSNTPSIGDFQFTYSNMMGKSCIETYRLSPHYEGTMLFFPSQLPHQVYPFYDCDEERISVSGNIMSDTSRKF